ncbi:MAG: TetR/AcrR family transcriptional regulator [Christensenellales bacterium]|jgi:AcrR family transcriptional regulator
MIKGEKRKYQIIRTAEDMFYEKGYENTTIQDIISAVKLSKGGFYHHYSSKEQLLDEICDKKATGYYLHALDAVEKSPNDPVSKFNAIYDKNGLWQEDNKDFLGLLINVAYSKNNLVMRERLKQKTVAKLLPLMQSVVKEGTDRNIFYTIYPQDICRIILNINNSLNDELAQYLLSCGYSPPVMGDIIRIIDLYRNVIERLLDAPYGSITLYQAATLSEICEEVWNDYVKVLYDNKSMYNPLAVGRELP